MAKGKKRYRDSSVPDERWSIPIPQEFTDMLGKPWTFNFPGEEPEILDLLDVLIYTARFCRNRQENPPPGDTNRLLGFCDLFLGAIKAESQAVEMPRNDFEWMISQFRDHGGNLWNPVDNADLVRWLERNVQKGIDDDKEEGQ